ncbi:hypothetical protein FOPG_17491 [Fusarium oxysporum f. sp. conglutinans race 2 54008]|uniref:Major facilitator superfamily (MFS) profile domain-containing protein n=2 Tax=Fusarium oxysporum f. sp. conglutinans TaxID=100902 RepID=A0A8H6LBI1_FUSOX|nr:hypothetical protein FOPG_17491 [Fusarium oxysporum f. sp. conglutinans race 2 54008]KAF6513183.1 hypothetical protein HZS61_007441 [Fusarium oxysporum f. sp. conglutinans]KAG7001726.1 MFS-type transporter EF102 [Fusarium oxysporum f. sp. conglutinans]
MTALAKTTDSDAKAVGPALTPTTTIEVGSQTTFKTYRRRYFVLFTVALINILLPWAWLSYAVVSTYAQELFGVGPTAINWFSTVYGLTFAPFTLSGWVINKFGMRTSLITGGVLMTVGSWIKYAGTLKGIYSVAMLGQVVLGLSQMFVIGLPPLVSELWFEPKHRTLPTALGSIAPTLGSMLGTLAQPYIATSPDKIAPSVLIVSVLTTVGSVLGAFIPSKPPTPLQASTAAQRPNNSFKSDIWAMVKSPEFWMIATPFIMGLAIFNVWASLLFLYLAPYGFPIEDAGLLIGLQTGLGAFLALLIAPVVDRKGWHLAILRVGYTIAGLCYVVFIWVPPSMSRVFAFCMAIVMAIVGTGTLAVALESLAEVLYPIAVELPSVTLWCAGNTLGAVLLIGFSYGYEENGSPPMNFKPAIYAQAAVGAFFCIVPINLLGLFGRKQHQRLKRREAALTTSPEGQQVV